MRRYRNNKKHILSLILLCITVCLSACSDTKGEDNDKNADGNVSVSVSLSETEERYCETLPYIINDRPWEKEDIYYPARQTESGENGILYHKHLR